MELFIRKTSHVFLKYVGFQICVEKRDEKNKLNMPRQSFDIRED